MDEPTQAEVEQREAEMRDRLVRALVTGDDDAFSREKAAYYLGLDHRDAFPIHHPTDDGRDRWITKVEGDTFDGRVYISSWIDVIDGERECPECGNERVKHASFSNGVIGGFRETCTVCGHVHAEDAG